MSVCFFHLYGIWSPFAKLFFSFHPALFHCYLPVILHECTIYEARKRMKKSTLHNRVNCINMPIDNRIRCLCTSLNVVKKMFCWLSNQPNATNFIGPTFAFYSQQIFIFMFWASTARLEFIRCTFTLLLHLFELWRHSISFLTHSHSLEIEYICKIFASCWIQGHFIWIPSATRNNVLCDFGGHVTFISIYCFTEFLCCWETQAQTQGKNPNPISL